MQDKLSTLEQFICKLTWDSLPGKTRETVKLCVLDALGCAVAGSRSENFSAHVENIISQELTGRIPVWGTSYTLNPGWAVFFNAHAAAYYDLDDGHRRAQGHPGAVIVPAALVTACHLKRSGRDFLEAVVVGYEVAIRSALLIRKLGGPRKGSGGWAAIGAAAAAARLMTASPDQALNAIGLAEYYAPQAPQDRSASFPSEMKEGIPWGAYSGVVAAQLACGGFGGMRPQLADAPFVDDLGSVFEIENTYFKTYASCRWAHPALDGLQAMLEKKRIEIEHIAEIRVFTFEKALLMQRSTPTSVMEAVYSIPFAISCCLLRGELGPQQLNHDHFSDKKILELTRRVRLIADEDLTNRFPGQCLQKLEVDFNNGETYRSPLLSAKGDPDNPYREEELTEKFISLTERILGSRTEQIPALIKELERHPVANLVTLLSP